VDFVAVVDQAIALLRQRDRLTSRTLQLHFQLDDAHLTALKEELIEGQRLAVDEAGRVLVWIGASGATASTGSMPLSSHGQDDTFPAGKRRMTTASPKNVSYEFAKFSRHCVVCQRRTPWGS
jgi:hypothetical protein